MGTITSGVGLVSGLNTSSIISQLMSIEAQPKTLLQTQINNVAQQKAAYTALATQLTTINTAATTLKDPVSFEAATATSSDPNVLTATASNGASVGSYQFQVARLVTTQQDISAGFADSSSAPIGAGTITIDVGGGELNPETELSSLNGGNGVSRGQFKITDRSGATATIDTSNAVSLDDVVKKINTSLNISVKASISNNHLVLTDQSGKTTSDLVVQDIGSGTAAKDLGLVADSSTGTIAGTDINYLSRSTAVSQINDGMGIRLGSGGGDLNLSLGDGQPDVQVSLAAKKTLGDVVDAINAAGGTRVSASISGDHLVLTNASGNPVTATDLNGSKAAEDLGLTTGANSSGTLTGSSILASIGTVLVSSLNGGSGLSLGTLSVQSKGASSAANIDLSGAKTFQQILDTINSANAGVTAALNNAGDGIEITDTSNGNGSLIIGGASATSLGIAGTFTGSQTVVQGQNLHHQYISQNTLLSDYNGGKGVNPGKFTITDSSGKVATVDLSSGKATRLSDVIANINSRGLGVTASINSQGNGLLLTDTAGGSGKLTVTDTTGTTAADLNIAGKATSTTIDGSFEKSITVTGTDTLSTLQSKINNLGFGVNAQIINDGSSGTPYRLSLTSQNSGRAGRVVVDSGTTNLGATTLIAAQDAAVFVGGSAAAQPLLVTSSQNTLANVINGVSINLVGVSDSPVSLSITNNSDNITKTLTDFTTNVNALVDAITTLTAFDSTTNTGGLLLGDSTVQQIQNKLYDSLNTVVTGAGKYHTLADIGITITDGAKINFDSNVFASAYAADPTSVKNLFTQATTGAGNVLASDLNDLIDPVSGIITVENKSLDSQTTDFNTRMDELNAILDQKRSRLQTQFDNMESVLAGLQSQQSSLSSLSSVKTG